MIIGVLGQAGSGKDTMADYLCARKGFVKVALADPIKRFCAKVFGFSTEQLWGPSHLRNQVDERFLGDLRKATIAVSELNLWYYGPEFLEEVLPHFSPRKKMEAFHSLWEWFKDVTERKEVTARYPLQTLGTEWGRAVDPQVWLRYCYEGIIPKVLSGTKGYNHEEGLVTVWFPIGQPPVAPRGVFVPDNRFRNEVDYGRARGALIGRIYRKGKDGDIEGGATKHASEEEQKSIPDDILDFVLDVPEGLQRYYEAIDGLYERLPKVGGLKAE